MNKRILLVFLATFLLSACAGKKAQNEPSQQTPASPPQSQVKPPNLALAATYNVELGLGYLQRGKMSRAKSKLLTALQQAPRSDVTNNAMAYFLERTGELRHAEQYYQKAIALAPGKGAPENNYGTFLCRQKRYSEAERHFLRALHDRSYLNTAEVYENAGLCATQVPDMQKARTYFQQAIKHDPNRPTSLLELGKIAYNSGQNRLADEYLQRYTKMSVPSAAATWLGFQLARKQGEKDKAASYAMKLRSAFPRSNEYQSLLKVYGKS